MVIHWEYHKADNTHMPHRALIGGKDAEGFPIYVGRVNHESTFIPANVIPDKKKCYTSFNGEEIEVEEFELLTGDHHKFTWEPASLGKVHTFGVATDKLNGDYAYIGRAVFNNAMVVGRVDKQQKCLFIASDGKEHALSHYEILVYHSTEVRRASLRGEFLIPNVL